MGMFSDLAAVRTFETGQYFKPGRYTVRIKEVKRERSAKNTAVSHFKVLTEVITCQATDGSQGPYAPGAEVNAIWNLTKASGPSNAKLFVRRAAMQYALSKGASQADLRQIEADFDAPAGDGVHPSEKHFEACVGPESVLKGLAIGVDAFDNPEKTFTHINWVILN
jgi:hypothetical protein